MPFGKWENFDACVRDFVSQGKPEESAKRICGALKARLEKEASVKTFSWEGEVSSQQANLIIGKAIHPVKTVHPEEWPGVRVYFEDELKKAADSLRGVPLLLDHNQQLNGKVSDAWYADGAVEFVADLDDPKVFGWMGDGTIRHCSVEYEWDNLEKVDGVAPRGITFTGLSLLKAYEPGDPSAMVQVWEAIVKRLKETRGQGVQVVQEPCDSVVSALRREKESLQNRIDVLEKIVEQNGRLGEAVIEPSATHEVEFVNRDEVLAELRKACYERVPKHWSYGAELQNRRLKDIIHRLESRGKGENAKNA